MKKIMLIGLAVFNFMLFADGDIVKDTNSKPVLAAVVELSPFADVTAKANILGVTMSNPILPTLALTASQQALYNEYGQMRTDMPMFCAVYVLSPAYKVAAKNSVEVDIDDIVQTVVVYPLAEKPNSFALRNAGSRKNPDGTIYVPSVGKRKGNYTVAYSKNQKVAAFASNAAMAQQALKDCEKFYLEEKKKANSPIVKMVIEKEGISFLSSFYELSLKMNAKEKLTTKPVSEVQIKNVKRYLESYSGLEVSLDIDSKGLAIKGSTKRKIGSNLPSYAGVKMPADILDVVSSQSKMFYSLNHLHMFGLDGEDLRKSFILFFSSITDSLKTSKDKKVVSFAGKLESILNTYAKEMPLPNRNHFRTAWFGMDAAGCPYIAEKENMDEVEKYYDVSISFMDSLVKAMSEVWPEYAIMNKGSEKGEYLLDWNAIVDMNGLQKGKPAPKELDVAKKKIKSVFGDSKGMLSVKKTSNGVIKFFGNPNTKLSTEKGDAWARLEAALPEVAKDRPLSVMYLMPYSIIRDAVLPIVAKTVAKAERYHYEMMIKAMLPSMPNSAVASALWSDSDGSERFILRVTSNELKSLGTIFNTLTSSILSSQGEE
jgi:hypothetical protein